MRRSQEVFGPFYMWVKRTQGCAVGGRWVSTGDACWGPVAGHHIKTRATGGTDADNLVPLCARHHTEVHTAGRSRFEARYATDLDIEAARLWGEWCDMQHAWIRWTDKPGEPAHANPEPATGGEDHAGSPATSTGGGTHAG